MDRSFMSSMMASFHNATPISPHSVRRSAPVASSSTVSSSTAKPQKAKGTTDVVIVQHVKKKKKKAPVGALSVEAVLAKRKRKEERIHRLNQTVSSATSKIATTSDRMPPRQAQPVAESTVDPSTSRISELANKRKKKKHKDAAANPASAIRSVSPDLIIIDGPARPIKPMPEIIEILDSDDEEPSIPTTSSTRVPPASTSAPSITTRESPSKKKKATTASSHEKAEKAARKRARAERRAKRAERRAKRASSSQPGDAAAASSKAKSGGKNVSSEVEAAMRMLAATNKVARSWKAKKDKPAKSLRAAWAPGGRKDAAAEEVVDDPSEARESSPPPSQAVVERREREAEERFNKLMLEAKFNAAPALRTQALSEPGWQTELRLNATLTNQQLMDQGVMIKKGHLKPSEKAIALQEMEAYRRAHGLTHLEIQSEMLARRRSDHRNAICRQMVRCLPNRSLKSNRKSLYRLCDSSGGYKADWPREVEDEIWALNKHFPNDWVTIAVKVNRDPNDVRLRYNNCIEPKMLGCTGPWTPSEDKELTAIVSKYFAHDGRDISQRAPKGFPWAVVAKELSKLRTATQCRYRWIVALDYRRHLDSRTPELRLSIIQQALAWNGVLSQTTQLVDIDPTGIIVGPLFMITKVFGEMQSRASRRRSETFREYLERLEMKVLKEVEERKERRLGDQ